MEAILARALEYTLKYWLKSFSRDQLKLQGRTVQLSNLDINGEALHASMGLPPALNVTKARVRKFEIILPYVSNVQVEPIIIQIDKLDLVLEENWDLDASNISNSTPSTTSSTKAGGYGFSDKIADGMTIQVGTVNLLLEMCGPARCERGAAWAPPLASITIRNLLLCTTNENWQVVNLKEARDFSNNKPFIYVFKKLEWESLSIDLLPHPDMFADASILRAQERGVQRDDDGAKRVFFGGERFLEGIAGEAYITFQRTEQNSPLGLEVQVHITEAVCPALSEPGLRALLRFLTGLCVCLNRGDVDIKSQQQSSEAAGHSIVSILVDHIFLCIKDSEFQLELLMQSLLFSRVTVSDGETAKNLTSVKLSGVLLRDTFSCPPCALVQPSTRCLAEEVVQTPAFAKDFCPPIYPLRDQKWQLRAGMPLMCLHSLQIMPCPFPPAFASKTVIGCQPIMIHLQEESCLRIASFLADGIVASPRDLLPDNSVNSLVFRMKELDVVIPLDMATSNTLSDNTESTAQSPFTGARLHMENLLFSESPSLKLRKLNLEKDPACFLLWHGQPIDASQKKWAFGASQIVLYLETSTNSIDTTSSDKPTSGSWRCVALKDASVEVAMVSADGSPLTILPPPGGIVRVGVACEHFLSNTSVEQLLFVLDLYAYFGRVGDKIALVSKSQRLERSVSDSTGAMLTDRVPCDTAASLDLKALQLSFLESSALDVKEMPLVQFNGEGLSAKVSHRTLGGAIAVSSILIWQNVTVSCVETERRLEHEIDSLLTPAENGHVGTANGCTRLRPVFWVHRRMEHSSNVIAQAIPFLNVSLDHMIPLTETDKECHNLSVSACVFGVRLGGGMSYTEALLHRFGVLGPDGGPGLGLSKILESVSNGPHSKLFKTSPCIVNAVGEDGSSKDGDGGGYLPLGVPDDVDICIELKDWLFSLEGTQDMAEGWWPCGSRDVSREEKSWHTTFNSILVKTKGGPEQEVNGKGKSLTGKYPVESVTVAVEGLQILKPQGQNTMSVPANQIKQVTTTSGGINLGARMVVIESNSNNENSTWMMENLKFSVKQPIEAVVTKEELQHLALLCKSEVDAMGRITAGVLKLLKLEQSIGQSAIDQLSNLGTHSFDKIFSQKNTSQVSSPHSIGLSQSSTLMNGSTDFTIESTVASLEETILDSQAKCTALLTDLSNSESSIQHLADIKDLTQKLQSMKSLLLQLRSQI